MDEICNLYSRHVSSVCLLSLGLKSIWEMNMNILGHFFVFSLSWEWQSDSASNCSLHSWIPDNKRVWKCCAVVFIFTLRWFLSFWQKQFDRIVLVHILHSHPITSLHEVVVLCSMCKIKRLTETCNNKLLSFLFSKSSVQLVSH